MKCEKCGKEFEISKIGERGKELPTPNEISFNFVRPNSSFMWVHKFTVCPECVEKVLKFFECEEEA